MKPQFLIVLLLAFFAVSCDKEETDINSPSDSFLPLQVGNYWRMDDQNYTEVRDSVWIRGKLYYKVYSLIGGDGISEDYLRIDEQQNLISSSPRYPDSQYIRARFGANQGETFQTLGNQTYNDYKVTVTKKTDKEITFSFDMIYHPNLKGHPHTVTYVKGLGWKADWKEVRISGVIVKK
jgi:hypothetical protein